MQSPESILVVEDDKAIAQLLTATLSSEGYLVSSAASATQAMTSLNNEKPNLIMLDWMLPDEDGVRFFRQIRASQKFHDVPIIMLTARTSDTDQAFALDQGIEDFIAKPFSRETLLARIRSVLRRTSTESLLVRGDLQFNIKQRRVSREDKQVQLYQSEARLLTLFMRKPGQLFSREDLIAFLNKGQFYVEQRTVDVHVSRLRKELKALGLNPIRTVRGSGYIFEE